MRLLIIPILLFTAIVTNFAQTTSENRQIDSEKTTEATTSDGKRVLLKANGTWSYLPTKEPQKATFTVVSPEKVSMFFSDYIGQKIKFESIRIIRSQTIQVLGSQNIQGYEPTSFIVSIMSGTGKIFTNTFLSASELTFVMDKNLARQALEHQEEMLTNRIISAGSIANNGIPANLYAEINEIGRYKVANIKCFEYPTGYPGTTKKIGDCP
jgi:hypothetical protein